MHEVIIPLINQLFFYQQKINLKKNETSIQQDLYLRKGQEIKSYSSNGNSCETVFLKKQILKMWVFILKILFFILPDKSISLSYRKQ